MDALIAPLAAAAAMVVKGGEGWEGREGKVQVSPSGLRFKIADDSKISYREENIMTNFGSYWDFKNVL